MTQDTYRITDSQWHQINDALLAAIAICGRYEPTMRDAMIKASIIMDDIIDDSDGDDDADIAKAEGRAT